MAFILLSMPTLTSFQHIRIDQYIREMNQIPKMVICNMEDNTEDEDDMMKQGITSNKKNLIKYASQKRMANDDIVKNISSTIMIDDQFETTAEMEQEYYSVISSELQKVTPILVDRDKKAKMLTQFSIAKYEQFIPNWLVLFMKVRNHNAIIDRF